MTDALQVETRTRLTAGAKETHLLQLLEGRLAHAALFEIGARGVDHLFDDLAVDVALSTACQPFCHAARSLCLSPDKGCSRRTTNWFVMFATGRRWLGGRIDLEKLKDYVYALDGSLPSLSPQRVSARAQVCPMFGGPVRATTQVSP